MTAGSAAVTVLLLVLGAAGGTLWARGARWQERSRAWRGSGPALVLLVLLGTAAVLAVSGGPPGPSWRWVVLTAGTVSAVAAGGPVATATLRLADPPERNGRFVPSDPTLLRGGAWIGALERAAVCATLLAGWPGGLAVVLAVKGLGRYPELRAPAAAERFIVGTFASVLWAAACAGVAAGATR